MFDEYLNLSQWLSLQAKFHYMMTIDTPLGLELSLLFGALLFLQKRTTHALTVFYCGLY